MIETFEEGIKRLEEIRIELDQSANLDKMVALYKEGMEITDKLKQMLDMTEKQIQIINGDEVHD